MSLLRRFLKPDPAKAGREFWEWFCAQAAMIHAADIHSDGRLTKALEQRLHKVSPHLAWQLSPPNADEIRTLEISGDGVKSMIPIVRALVAQAPPIPSWSVVAFRQPIEDEVTIQMGDITLNFESIRFVSRRQGTLIALDLYVDGYEKGVNESPVGAVYLLLDSLIGEYIVMTQIGEISFNPLVSAPAGHRPLRELREEV